MEETVKTEVVNNTTQNKGNKNFNKDRKPRKEFKKNFEPKKKLLEEKVISITRVTKVTKGGRHFRFAATMVVGDGKGLLVLVRVLKYLKLLRREFKLLIRI